MRFCEHHMDFSYTFEHGNGAFLGLNFMSPHPQKSLHEEISDSIICWTFLAVSLFGLSR